MNVVKNVGLVMFLMMISIPFFGQQKNITTIKGKKILVKDLDKFINSQLDSLKVPAISLAIINKGRLVHYKNYGVKNLDTKEAVNQKTIFELCSVSKPVFAYFALKQAEKGILDLDKPLYEYYIDPKIDTAHGFYKLITARMVLNHCSGFPNWRENEDFKNTLFFKNKPGMTYGYSGEGYQYLARVLGKILNKTDVELNDYCQEEVVKPLKVKSMNFIWDNKLRPFKAYSHSKGKPTDNGSQGPPDWFGSAGSLHTNAGDYALFLLSLMNKNTPINHQLIKLNTDLPKEPDGLFRSFGFPYKMADGKVRYYHSGNNSDAQSYCHFYKEEKMGLVMFVNSDNFFKSGLAQKVLVFLEEEFTY